MSDCSTHAFDVPLKPCPYCTLKERNHRNQSWREGPLRIFSDGERLNARIESDGGGYILYVEHPIDDFADDDRAEWTAANVPITHCPWCGGAL